jgi:ribosome recycling factor
MPADDILMDCEEHMEKALEHLRHEMRGVRHRAGVAGAGGEHPGRILRHANRHRAMASISVPEATQILIKPFDASAVKYIEKALNDAKLPLTVRNDGKQLRLLLPPMSQELRKKMVAQVKGFSETAKVAIRNARRDANKLPDTEEKGGVITEDQAKKLKEDIQELTKRLRAQVDDSIAKKEKEIMEV